MSELVDIIENLKAENELLNNNLSETLETIKMKDYNYQEKIIENEEKLADLNKKLQKFQNANKQLSDLIVELKLKEGFITPSFSQPIKEESQLIYTPPQIFHKMFNALDDKNKEQIINQLIQDLNENNIRDKRIHAIKILSSIDDPNIFQAFKSLIKDKDWIIKLYLIKALEKFKNPELKEVLEELQRDEDVDVREAASNLMCKFDKI